MKICPNCESNDTNQKECKGNSKDEKELINDVLVEVCAEDTDFSIEVCADVTNAINEYTTVEIGNADIKKSAENATVEGKESEILTKKATDEDYTGCFYVSQQNKFFKMFLQILKARFSEFKRFMKR